jgi:N-ethylmaleimide reductase
LLIEAIAALVAEWGAERVGVRLSPTNPFNDMADSNPAATFATAVGELDRFGLAYLHIVEPAGSDPIGGGKTPDIRFFRTLWRGALMANKGYDLARANKAIETGRADLVSFAVLFLANPDLPIRFRRGGPFNPPDRKTFYGGSAAGYTDYPPIDG